MGSEEKKMMILTYWLVFKGLVVIDCVSFDAGSQSLVIYPPLSKSSASLSHAKIQKAESARRD